MVWVKLDAKDLPFFEIGLHDWQSLLVNVAATVHDCQQP